MKQTKIIIEKVTSADIEAIKFMRNAGNVDTAKNILRQIREQECFSKTDRPIWYKKLSSYEQIEVDNWHGKWLEVTDTFEIPEKPYGVKL